MLVIKVYKRGEKIPNQIQGYYMPSKYSEGTTNQYKVLLENWLERVKKGGRYADYNRREATRSYDTLTKDMVALVWEEDSNYIGEMSP